MAEADWDVLADGLAAGVVDRGVTVGETPPAGGGSFVYGFNSLSIAAGAVGLKPNQTNFNPTAANKGGSIRAAMKKAPSGGTTGWSVFIGVGLQGTSVNDTAYLLGLCGDSPVRIQLRKGVVADGLPAGSVDPDAFPNILAKSIETVAIDTWVHLRLDWIVNLTGDVILQAYKSDLDNYDVDSPLWTAIPGIPQIVDDALQVLTGSPPLTSGRFLKGFECTDSARRAFIDHVEVARQL